MLEIRSDERPTPVVVVEPDSDDSAVFVESRWRRRSGVAVLVGILSVIVVLLGILDRSVPDTRADGGGSTEPRVSAEPRSIEPVVEPSDWMSTWPDPPEDHAPIVIGRPPLGEPLIDRAPGHTLLYVNTIDRPTVVDLARGRRQELTISTERMSDSFLVEDGQVVDDDPLNPDLPEAGDRAVLVVVHRAAAESPGLVGGWSSSAGPHLCLDTTGCPQIQGQPGSIETNRQRIEQIRLDDTAELRAMFEGALLDGVDRFVVVTTPGGNRIRIPVPRPGTTIWLLGDLE